MNIPLPAGFPAGFPSALSVFPGIPTALPAGFLTDAAGLSTVLPTALPSAIPARPSALSAIKLREKMRTMKPSEMHTVKADELNAPISSADFQTAMAKVQSSLSGADIERYEQWLADYGSA
ncbi:hypothetical protein HDU89_008605 [Geranomyces variabilis]|nr:hypothetical protein HDU89_008605 [Geranomyces variabilis]